MIKNILCTLLLLSAVSAGAYSQQNNEITDTKSNAYKYSTKRVYYIKREPLINWMPEQKEAANRYTIAIRPFYLINKGKLTVGIITVSRIWIDYLWLE